MKAGATEIEQPNRGHDSDQELYLKAWTRIARLHRRLLEEINTEFDRVGSILAHGSRNELAGDVEGKIHPRGPSSLSPRQHEVLELLIKGMSNKEIARILALREGTVKIHIAALFRNLGVANRARAAVVGARLRLDLGPAAASRFNAANLAPVADADQPRSDG